MPLWQVRLEGLTADLNMRKQETSPDRTTVSATALALLMLAGTTVRIASAKQSDLVAPSQDIAVYVRDFELSVAPAASPAPPNVGYSEKQGQDLQLRSHQVQDYFADTLIERLRKQGYSSSRNEALPGKGILLEGVFAETDQKNRIRRALLGSESPGSKLTLYVGAFDRNNVSQPLYVEAPVQEPHPNYGPVITLNSYIPMAKYEINKNIAEEDVRNTCAQIAADLTVLLNRNPAALAHAK